MKKKALTKTEDSIPEKKPSVGEIIRRVIAPNASAEDRAAMRQVFIDKPEGFSRTKLSLDQMRDGFIEAVGDNGLTKEWSIYECEQLEKQLAVEGDGMLEKLLIKQIVFAYIRMSFIESGYTNVHATKDGLSFERSLYWERRLTAAHRRFDQSTVALARARRLLQPYIKTQINIDQINALLNGVGNSGQSPALTTGNSAK